MSAQNRDIGIAKFNIFFNNGEGEKKSKVPIIKSGEIENEKKKRADDEHDVFDLVVKMVKLNE